MAVNGLECTEDELGAAVMVNEGKNRVDRHRLVRGTLVVQEQTGPEVYFFQGGRVHIALELLPQQGFPEAKGLEKFSIIPVKSELVFPIRLFPGRDRGLRGPSHPIHRCGQGFSHPH